MSLAHKRLCRAVGWGTDPTDQRKNRAAEPAGYGGGGVPLRADRADFRDEEMSTRAPAIPNTSNGNPTVGQAATAGLGADAPEVIVNGVFLSPRVIDRRAYGELAGELRDLVERSAAERAGLSAALERAGRAAHEFRQHEQSQSGNLELAARALRTFDERTTKVEAILTKAASQTQLFEKLEAHAGGLIDEKIQALEARLDAVTSAATAKKHRSSSFVVAPVRTMSAS